VCVLVCVRVYFVAFYRKYSRALTFEREWQATATSADVSKLEAEMREWDAKIGAIQNDFFSFVRGGELQDAKEQWCVCVRVCA
jgi:hypothetical protein